ncbi:MAG TPA: DUF4167 domain-containing protein [Sphingomonas sp.]
MINNRQNGRRRGRGGPQVRNGSGNGPERGNRIDNRARGNAAQLHEKYRNLARDAQTQGDRVMTEYYLQFADHYFRVLNESRVRFEEQNPNQNQPRRQHSQNDDFDEGFEGEAGDENSEAEVAPRRFDREPRRETAYDDGEQPDRDARGQNGADNGYHRDGQNRDNQNREGQNREGQNREGQQQGRDYRDGQRERGNRDNGNRDNGHGRENRQEGRNEGRNGQQARDNRDNRPVVAEREEQRPSRDAQSPRQLTQAQGELAVTAPAAEAEVVRPRRGRPPRRVETPEAGGAVVQAQIEIDRLPPAFAPSESGESASPARTRRKAAPSVPEAELRAVEGEPAEPAPRRRRARRDAADDSNVAA